MSGKRVQKQPQATVPQAWQAQAREEAVAEKIAMLNGEIARAMVTVANEDVDVLVEERGAPQDLVNGIGAALTLLWVRARWNGMAETEATLAALHEAKVLVSDLLLKAWVRGAKGGGVMQPDDAPDAVEVRPLKQLVNGEEHKTEEG